LFFNAWKYEQEPAHISIPLILEILVKLYEKNKDQIDKSYTDRKHNFKERLGKVISGLSMKTTFGVPNLATIDIGYDFSKAQQKKLSLRSFNTQLEIYRLEHTKVYDGIDLIVNLVGNPELVGHGRNKGVKLVVFIDDLDRCKPEKAAEIFEFIKVFLNISGIVFILGLNDKIIERAIRERYSYLEGGFSPIDYVKKIVQLPVYIPVWKPSSINKYVQFLLRDYDNQDLKAIFNENTDLILQGVEHNPREVKRFLNLFILSYYLQKEEGQTELPPDKLLAIQAIVLRWHWFYEAIVAEQSFLNNLRGYLLSPASGDIANASDDVRAVLAQKSLVNFLRGHGKVIFETKVDWWSEEKIVTRDLVIKYNIEEPSTPTIPSNFAELDKEKQLEVLKLTPENEQAEKIGLAVGGLDFRTLDKGVQELIWKLEKKNRNFALGLGSALGNNLPLFDMETRNKILEMASGNTPAFLRSFGHSIGEFLSRFEEDALQRFAALSNVRKADFAIGLITAAGNNFESVPETVREHIWGTIKENGMAAHELGQALGLSFSSIGDDTRKRLWKEARHNTAFGSGLGGGLGQRFSSLTDEDRAETLNAAKPEFLLATSFVESLARALGEDFSVLDSQKQREVWDNVRQNDVLAKAFGEALRRHYSELDEETEREALQTANEVPIFKAGYKTS
jgi:hypothetical protein